MKKIKLHNCLLLNDFLSYLNDCRKSNNTYKDIIDGRICMFDSILCEKDSKDKIQQTFENNNCPFMSILIKSFRLNYRIDVGENGETCTFVDLTNRNRGK